MKAKQKAIELIDKYRTYIRIADKYNQNLPSEEIYLAKKCALIAVDEILNIDKEKPYQISGIKATFYKEVKKEIENPNN